MHASMWNGVLTGGGPFGVSCGDARRLVVGFHVEQGANAPVVAVHNERIR